MSRSTAQLLGVCLLSIALGVGGTVAVNRDKGPHSHMGTALYADCSECARELSGFVLRVIDSTKAPKAEKAKPVKPAGPPKPEASE